MKLVTFRHQGKEAPGVLSDKGIISLAAEFKDTRDVITQWSTARTKVQDLVLRGDALSLSSVTLLAPLSNPPRLFAIGLNYAEHAAESKMKVQNVPTVFFKLASAIVGTGEEVTLHANATQPDYEAELAVVIGKHGHHIAEKDWQSYVFGYTIINDVSARGVQLATSQWTLAKSFPGFAPMGPSIVSADEISDPHNLNIKLSIDGEILQSANTSDLIFRIPALLAYISSIVPLEPGDIISTGTPSGVGMGRTPQRWLQPGEEMVVEIEKIGILTNRVVAPKAQN